MLIRAKITAKSQVSGLWKYGWEEQESNLTTGADGKPLSYRRGTTSANPAIELNNNEVSVGTYVWLRVRGYVKGEIWWEFAYEPAGGTSSLGPSYTGPLALYNPPDDGAWHDVPIGSGSGNVSITLTAGRYLIYGVANGIVRAATVSGGIPVSLEVQLTGFATQTMAVVGSSADTINYTYGSANFTVFANLVTTTTVTLQCRINRNGGSSTAGFTGILGGAFALDPRCHLSSVKLP